MIPIEAIEASPPNVWLTSAYGFTPERWGFVGFSIEWQRNSFIQHTEPGALVVIYGSKHKAPKHQRGKVIGILQVSHSVGSAEDCMDPSEWLSKSADPDRRDKWNLAVKATRAWHVAEKDYPAIDDFAPDTYSLGRAQVIGSQGMRLSGDEARRILELTLIETSVFGEIPIDAAVPVLAKELFAPTKPGPVSQAGFFCKESEGPKGLYVLRLVGDESAFLGREAGGKAIVKVGMSGDPPSRCAAFNNSLPSGAYRWELIYSHASSGRPPFPSSKPAIMAETAMKARLHGVGASLGREFFLADMEFLQKIWTEAMEQVIP